MAPEVLQGSYAMECDIWSLGVITYFMLSGTLPFPGRNDDEKEDRILRSAQNGIPMGGKHWSEVCCTPPRSDCLVSVVRPQHPICRHTNVARSQVSAEAKDFVKQLLRSDPRKRLSGKLALHHPWITKRASLSDAPLSEGAAVSLKKYADAHRFEKVIRHQMATHLTSTELHRLRNVFEKLDADGTGNVSIEAMMKTLKEDAADAKTADTLASIDLTRFDLDGDGQIDWQEFVAGAMAEHEIYNEDNLEKVFHDADKDKNGTLCQKEVRFRPCVLSQRSRAQDHVAGRPCPLSSRLPCSLFPLPSHGLPLPTTHNRWLSSSATTTSSRVRYSTRSRKPGRTRLRAR